MLLPTAVKGLSWVTRNFHSLPGRWRIVHWLERYESVFAGLPPATVRVAPGCRMRVNPAGLDGRPTYVHGFHPRDWLTKVFTRVVRPGDCVLDVGANIGVYTVLAARLVGPSGCVHAFEPSPEVVPQLELNVSLNRFANVQVHHQAVTDRCGQIEFSLAPTSQCGLSSIRTLPDQAATVTEVPTLSLDSILEELPPVRLVKIDVEGAELLVLQGMGNLIERDRPFILLELTDEFLRQLGASADQLCTFLREAGYEIYRIAAQAHLHPLATPPADQCNILARHRESHEPLPVAS